MPGGSGPEIAAQNAQRRERIVELTRQGWSAAQIADELKITARTVVRVRVQCGIAQPGPRLLTDDELGQIEAMLADGCSITEVARSLGRNADHLQHKYRGRGWTRLEAGRFGALRYEMRRKFGIDI